MSNDDQSSDAGSVESDESSLDIITSPTKVFTAQLRNTNEQLNDNRIVATKPSVETTDQFGFTFDKIAAKDLERTYTQIVFFIINVNIFSKTFHWYLYLLAKFVWILSSNLHARSVADR